MTLTCLDWWLWWLTLGILSSFHSWARLAWADSSSSQGRRVMTSLSSVASRTSLRSQTRYDWRFLVEVQPCSVESNRQGRGLADWVRHWLSPMTFVRVSCECFLELMANLRRFILAGRFDEMTSSASLVSDSCTGRTVWPKGCHSSCVLKRTLYWDSFSMLILQSRTQRKALPLGEASRSWLACCWSKQMDSWLSYLHWSLWLPYAAVWYAREDQSGGDCSAWPHRCILVHLDSSLTCVFDRRCDFDQLWCQLCPVRKACWEHRSRLIECGMTHTVTSAPGSDSVFPSYGLSAWMFRLHESFQLAAIWHSSMIASLHTMRAWR